MGSEQLEKLYRLSVEIIENLSPRERQCVDQWLHIPGLDASKHTVPSGKLPPEFCRNVRFKVLVELVCRLDPDDWPGIVIIFPGPQD